MTKEDKIFEKGIIELGAPSVRMLSTYLIMFLGFYILYFNFTSEIAKNLSVLGGVLLLFESGRIGKEIISRVKVSDALIEIYDDLKNLEIGGEYSLEFPDEIGQYRKSTLRRVV